MERNKHYMDETKITWKKQKLHERNKITWKKQKYILLESDNFLQLDGFHTYTRLEIYETRNKQIFFFVTAGTNINPIGAHANIIFPW